MQTKLVYSAGTDTGRVRKINEDSYLAKNKIFAVADGMGGHQAGEVASQTGIDFLQHEDIQQNSPAKIKDDLKQIFLQANLAIYKDALSSPDKKGMGTTLTTLFLSGDKGIVAHVGDSRLYLLRDNKITQLTEDHSLVASMLKKGQINAEEARTHPQRSIITRALGVNPDIEAVLDIIPIKKDDIFLLCTDGISSQLEDESIKEIIYKTDSPSQAVKNLLHEANMAGGSDNATAIVIKIKKIKPSPEKKGFFRKIINIFGAGILS